jgi:CO/xanthine dehydrogenase FAD-binding subunit
MLAKQAGKVLEGKAVDNDLIDQAAKTASGETSPIDDVRSSAWYRRRAVEALTKQLLGRIFA